MYMLPKTVIGSADFSEPGEFLAGSELPLIRVFNELKLENSFGE